MVETGPDERHGNVPRYLTSFVGREQELAEIRQLLLEERVRLLTLTGPGGMGKTRLAARVAEDLEGVFEDGIGWVELAGLAEARLVPQSVVMALGLGEAPGAQSVDLLTRTLQVREMLLVLDNCEHLIDGCARVVETLLRTAPDLKVLVTSRERLNIAGERVWLVPGLAQPAEQPEALAQIEAGDPPAFDALQLFVERARAAVPSFQLTVDNAPAVLALCRRLDGLPLALELAAARMRTLSAAQIAGRLGQRLELLTGGPRTASARQRTLRMTLDWSHDLLSEEEQVVFRRLSVFRGLFSPDAAQAVAGGDLAEPVVGLLSGLVDKSMVVVERSQPDHVNYRLLDTIRHYAAEKLAAAGEPASAREAHLRYYSQLAGASVVGLRGSDQPQWVPHLIAENDNLRVALDWGSDQCRTTQSPEHCQAVMQLAADLFWFWSATDAFEEGREWLDRIVQLPASQDATQPRAHVIWAAGSMAWLVGDFAAAAGLLKKARALYDTLGDQHGVANAEMMLGRMHLYQSEPETALGLLRTSAAMFERSGHSHDLGLALTALSAALAMRGDFDAACAAAGEALDIFERLGDVYFTSLAWGDLGWVTYHEGDLVRAEEYLNEALAIRQQIDARWLTAQALTYLAEIARFRGDFGRSETLLEESLALADDIGARAWLAHGARGFGLVALRQGRFHLASSRLLDSLAEYHELEDWAGFTQALEGLAAVAVSQEAWSLAGVLYGAAERLREIVGPPRTPAERDDLAWVQAQFESHWAGEPVATAREEGRGLSVAEALQAARKVPARLQIEPVEVLVTPHDLLVYALGATQVYREERLVAAADWSYAKPRELLFYFMANPPRTKEQVGLVFWPDASPAQLRRNFRAALYHLRQALGRREWVLYEEGRYGFNRSLDYWYDVEAFERGWAAAQKLAGVDPEQAAEMLSDTLELYRGEYLEDVGLDDWAVLRREELHEMFLTAQARQGQWLFDSQQYEAAAAAFRALLAHDNLLESAHRALMRCYARLGQRNLALRHYADLVDLLDAELGAAPAPETLALYEQLQAGQPL